MKNLKACLSPQFSSSDSFQNIRSPSNFSAGLSASIIKEDNGLTIKDLKQEYNKALSYIDKLKIEQNNLKNTLKMTLDHKPETPLNEISHHSYNRSFSSLQTKPRIMRGDPRIKELDTENEDLKCQLDTAMVRISKLQKEKQISQDKINQLEAQNQGSQVYIKDIKSLTHDIHILSAKLEELEQENMLLRKQNQKNHHEKENQEPSQNLLRYVAYVAKIASGMPQSNFARSCYEERFPRDVDTVEQLISGEFEPVLLRSFKYITDLLLNISSLPLDETSMNPATPTQNTNHSYFMYQSNPTRDTRDTVNTNLNTNSNILSKNSHVYDSKPSEIKKPSQRVHNNTTIREPSLEYISEKRQPSQEAADNSFQENGMESSERAFSSLRQNHRLQDGYNSQKGHKKSSDFEQFKNALQKIVNPREEYMNKTTKPQRGHARHYSTMGGTSNRPQDSYRLEQGRNHSQAKKESSYRDAKSIGMSSYLDDDISQSGYRQRGNESRGVRMDESSERHGNLKNQSRVRYEETEGNLETEGQYQEENMRYEREIQQQLQAKQPKKRMKDLKGASRGGDSSYREVRDILEEDRPRYEDRRQANYSVSSTRQQVQPRHVNEFDQRDQREERDTRDNRDRSNPRDQREYREQEKEHRRERSNAREQQREYREEREHHIDRSYPREQERDQRDRSNPREQRESREEERSHNKDRSHPREQEREYRDQQREQQQPRRGNSRNGGYVQRERERDDYEGEEEEYQQYEQQQQQRKKQRGVSSREGSPERKYKQGRNAHHHQDVIPEVTAETYETRISTRIKDSTKKESHRNKETFRTTDREGQYEPMAIRQQQQEEEEPSTARNEDEEKNELWDKNRKELAKMRKKLSSTQLNISQDSKYKDFSTFRVSFGRTESKIMKGSPSHSPGKGSPSIFDVPKRKKVDHLTSNFDIITGKNIAGERNESDRMSNVTSPVSAVSGGRWERTGRSQMSKNKIVLERSLSQPKDSLENEAESAKRVIVE